ncbi:MAG TPA: biotin-dependent carboxyltransferase family protein [Candidatus Acidoferrales bacterium]|nr:biotin-dependent carboxyltransferase family protein [Candidatus Acidoferrales bacterium]
MSSILIQSPGLLTTVQDLGRQGFGTIGVSPSGAADSVSLRLGNRLVANNEGAAALEMTLIGGAFAFPDGGIVALAGSDFGARLDDSAIDTGTSVEVRPGQTLRIGPTRSGARCYLCIEGGIAVPPFLGSASTHLLSGLGGFEGRALRKGDVLQIGLANVPFRRRTIAPRAVASLSQRNIFRVTRGPQADWFDESSFRAFFAATYRVGEQSNRMGIRLDGGQIAQSKTASMITEGVSLGAIQMPPGGLPIILFVEQQTTGGYPKIANVISADLHRLGQLRPRDEIRFELVTFETARALLIDQQKMLASPESIIE